MKIIFFKCFISYFRDKIKFDAKVKLQKKNLIRCAFGAYDSVLKKEMKCRCGWTILSAYSKNLHVETVIRLVVISTITQMNWSWKKKLWMQFRLMLFQWVSRSAFVTILIKHNFRMSKFFNLDFNVQFRMKGS